MQQAKMWFKFARNDQGRLIVAMLKILMWSDRYIKIGYIAIEMRHQNFELHYLRIAFLLLANLSVLKVLHKRSKQWRSTSEVSQLSKKEVLLNASTISFCFQGIHLTWVTIECLIINLYIYLEDAWRCALLPHDERLVIQRSCLSPKGWTYCFFF